MTAAQKPRAHSRSKISGVDVFCYRAALSTVPRIRKNIGVEVLDISPGGARIEVNESLKEGETVTVEVKDYATGESFRAQGEVRWAGMRKGPAGTVHYLGLQFRDIYTPVDRRERFTGAGRDEAASQTPRASLVRPSSGGSEKRVASRFILDDYVVTCIRPQGLSPGGLKRNSARQLLDLSLTGAQLSVFEMIEPSETVSFTLHVQKFSESLQIPSRVRWCRPESNVAGGYYLVGLQFTHLTPDVKKKIEFFRKWFSSAGKK